MDLNEFWFKGQNPGNVDDNSCRLTIKVHSAGFLRLITKPHDHFLNYALPRLLLQLALIFICTQSLHLLLRRFGLPRIISKILAGILLGKTVFGNVAEGLHRRLFPKDDIVLDSLSKFGFIFFMFMVGVKMNPSMIWKAGRKAISIGLVASLTPLIINVSITYKLPLYFPLYRRPAIETLTRVLSMTPFPVIASLLVDLKIMNSEIGRLSLASALVADLVNKFAALIANVHRILEESSSTVLGGLSFIQSAVIIMCVLLGTKPLFSIIIKRTPEGKPVKQIYIVIICGAVLYSALLCTNVGLQHFYIPFLLGLSIPDGPPLGSSLAIKLDTFISGLLAPLLITKFSLWIDLTDFYDLYFLRVVSIFTLMSVVLKFVFVLGPALLNSLPVRDAVTISIIMGAQGIVQGAYYDTDYRNQNLDGETFTLVIMLLALNAAATHLSVKYLYDYSRTYRGYEKRNILNTPDSCALRVLACSHRPDDALAAIRLLEASSSSKDAPIQAYALNLVELVGRATPLIINHGLGQKNQSGDTLSQQIIRLWQNFEQQNSGRVSVQAFTSMSLPKFMHHDVCSMAFDNLTSLIILPFHQKWNQHGKVVFESNVQRTINREVLETAPCSVGILVDRRKIRNEASTDQQGRSKYYIAVVFVGGSDDREALAYAKRMARSLSVQLTVVRLVYSTDVGEDKWDSFLDREILREIKLMSGCQNNVIYREEIATDGGETALVINAMADAFDLIMVGRSHRNDSPLLLGLSQWNAIPELGPIGDILASSEINRPVSVLVVRQQSSVK